MQDQVDYIIAITNYYGIVSVDHFVTLMKHLGLEQLIQEEIDKTKFEQSFIVAHDGYFIHESLIEDYPKIISKINRIPYHIPSIQELNQYRGNHYDLFTSESIELIRVLLEEVKLDAMKTENIVDELVITTQMGIEHKNPMTLYQVEGVVFHNEEERRIVRHLTEQIHMRIRRWPYRGHNKKEYEEFTKQYKNISRNDMCPCGSGLKYKKCCLNKTYK